MSLDIAVTAVTAFAVNEIYSVARCRHEVSDMRIPKRIDAQCSLRFIHTACALLLLAHGAVVHAGSNVRESDAGRISVTAVAGKVDVTMAAALTSVAPNTTVLLPARIVTGSDGNLGLTQAGTHVNVANDSDVEIPAEAVDGNLIARLVQHRGNVFYDVAPRDLGKLRVETPLLVAVIKGTQFNVAVQEDSTTISLFEGRLEIRTPDDGQVVQLSAGEIAIRSRVDSSIRVVGMNDERVGVPAARPAVQEAADARIDLDMAEQRAGRLNLAVDLVNDTFANAETEALQGSIGVKPALELDGAGVEVELAGSGIELGLATGADLGAAALDVGLDAGVDLGAAAVDLRLDAGVDLGAAAVDLRLDAGVDLGAAAVDLGLDAGVDLGGAAIDLGLDTGVDLGAATVDLNLDTGVDLGDVVLDTGLDAGLDLGAASDVGLDASVALADVLDTSLDAGLTVDTGTLDLGLDAGLDVGGVLDVGLDLDGGSGGLDLSLDLGGGGDAAPPSGGLGGLLGGLLSR